MDYFVNFFQNFSEATHIPFPLLFLIGMIVIVKGHKWGLNMVRTVIFKIGHIETPEPQDGKLVVNLKAKDSAEHYLLKTAVKEVNNLAEESGSTKKPLEIHVESTHTGNHMTKRERQLMNKWKKSKNKK